MKRRRKTSPAAVIAFSLPPYDDIRWERVEALYREIARLDPEWFTHDRGNSSFRLVMEQTFCRHLLSKLMGALDDR